MVGGYKVITLCGSTRFKDQFIEAQKRLTLEGNIVISVGLFGHSGDQEVWENMDEGTMTKTKKMLDDMHKRKIDMSDGIYVINVGGYIGESTRAEITYAKAYGKTVQFLEDSDEAEGMKPLYCFIMDEETGIISKHEIPEYRTLGERSDHRGRMFIFKSDFYKGKRDEYDVYENDFNKVFHGKIITFNPSYEDALSMFDEYLFEKKEAARKEAEKYEVQYERIRQNMK